MKKLKAGLCLLAVFFIAASVPFYSAGLKNAQRLMGSEIIVLDPGHGGFDGGAESAAGVSEKDINLAIAENIKLLAERDGWKVLMTRDRDKALNTSEEGSIRSKKTSDLLERKKIIDRTEPVLTVSIHLNSFKQDRRVKGAQVFYPEGAERAEKLREDRGSEICSEEEEALIESKKLAEIIRGRLAAGLGGGEGRAALPKGDMKLFKDINSPIVLVECGFLSNSEEAGLLESEEYQREIAKYIYEGILEYTGKKPRISIEIRDSGDD